jgi:hypothetical protein
MQLHINIREDNKSCRGENGVYGSNVDMEAIIVICNVPPSLCFVPGSQFAQSSSDVSGEAATEKCVFVG